MAEQFDPYYTWLGIPPDEQPANHYRLLGLKLLEANPTVISNAADQRMAHLKSLQGGKHAVASQRLLNEVSAAAACLLQADKRQAYDQSLPRLQPQAPIANQPPSAATPETQVVPAFSISTASRASARRSPAFLFTAVACAALVIAVVGLSAWQLSQAQSQVASATAPLPSKVTAPPPPPSASATTPVHSQASAVTPAPAQAVETPATKPASSPAAPSVAQVPALTNPEPVAAAVSPASSQVEPASQPAPAVTVAVSTPAQSSGASAVALAEGPASALSASPAASATQTPEKAPRSLADLLNEANDIGAGLENPADTEMPVMAVDLPSPESLEKARAQIVELLGEEAKQAAKPEQKTLLARKMLGLARETVGDDASRYVLQDSARKLFIGAEDVRGAVLTVRRMSGQFKLDADALYTSTFTALSDASLPAEKRAELATALMDSIHVALVEHKFSLANDYSLLATKAASRAKDVELRKSVSERRSYVQRLNAQVKAAEEAGAALATNPNDAAANLVVGKFKCFILGDWNAGVAHLLKCGDSDYVAAAEADAMAVKGEKEAALPAADAWCALAESAKKQDKDASSGALERAKKYYEEAITWSAGLDKVRIEKQLAAMGPAADADAKQPEANSQEHPGLIGRGYLYNRDSGTLLTYQPGYLITDQETRNLYMRQTPHAPGEIRIEFNGVLSVPTTGQVGVHHAGGTPLGGVHTLFIDGKKVSEVGDDRSKGSTFRLRLAKGEHHVRWVLSGGLLGNAQLDFFSEDQAGFRSKLDVHCTNQMVAAARSQRIGSEVHFGSASRSSVRAAAPAFQTPRAAFTGSSTTALRQPLVQ